MALLVKNGLVVTPTARDVRAERATVTVEGDRIARVAWGSEADRVEPAPGDRVIDGTRSIAIPGLVDAHAHCYGVLIPGLIDRLPLDTRMPHLAACLAGWTERDTWVATALGALRMLRNGTTTVLENVLQGLDAAEPAMQALLASGIRAMVGPMVADRPYHETMPGLRERLPETFWPDVSGAPGAPPEEVVGQCRALARRWQGAEGRLSVCLSPSTPHRCTDRLLALVAEAARAERLPVHTHLLETRPQAAAARRLYGRSMVEHVKAIGLLGPGFLGAHSVWLADGDLDLMAEAGAGISHNPLSNLYLGSGIARVPELLRRGVAVGTGSDGPNCGSTTSLFEIMKLAAVVHRLGEPDGEPWIGPSDAFRMATLVGARALGLDRDIGSIEPGKKADLVLLDANAPAFVPLNDPVAQLVYGEGGGAVDTVLVGGEVVIDGGRPVRLDLADLVAEARELGARIAERARPGLTRAAALMPYVTETYRSLLRDFERGGRGGPS
jgi:cytosine/adenosine deaminase-related metal-dependent hydrolase